MTELANPLIDELRACGEKLPVPLRERFVSEGSAIIPTLVDVLLKDGADDDEGDWSSIHAVDLLADLKAEAAIGPVLRVLAETDWDHIIHDRIILRLPELGSPVLEPALSMLAEGPPDDVAESLCAVASQLGVRDERVFEYLASRFAEPRIWPARGWQTTATRGASRSLRKAFGPSTLTRIPSSDPSCSVTSWKRTNTSGVRCPTIFRRMSTYSWQY